MAAYEAIGALRRATMAGCQQSGGAVALRSADGCCCFVAGLSLLEQGRQQDLDAHLVGLLLLWRLDQLADYGGDGGFTGRGRDRGGPGRVLS